MYSSEVKAHMKSVVHESHGLGSKTKTKQFSSTLDTHNVNRTLTAN